MSAQSVALFFRVGLIEEARDLVMRHHYSRRFPSNVQVVGSLHRQGGLFGDHGNAVAAVTFSIPPTRWSEPVLELSRLVQDGSKPSLSLLIGSAVKWLKREGVDLLVSFADRTQGHHGGVYQASSWDYAGCRDRRMDGLLIDGNFWPGRSCNSKFGTQSPDKVSRILGREVVPHYDEGKHLYFKALGAKGRAKAERLGLARLDYPKPQRDGRKPPPVVPPSRGGAVAAHGATHGMAYHG